MQKCDGIQTEYAIRLQEKYWKTMKISDPVRHTESARQCSLTIVS